MKKTAIQDVELCDWFAISCPIDGLRLDRRTLEFLDDDHDGRIRSDAVKAAFDFLKEKGVDAESLRAPAENADELEKSLADNLARQAELAKALPTADDLKAVSAWEAKGRDAAIAVCGDGTAAAESALAAVEKTIDEFFTPPDDMPLVTDAPDPVLPLADHLNPKYADAVVDFAAKCVQPILGAEKTSLTRREWNRVKAAFAPYRDWRASKPVPNAPALDALVEEEKLLRYRLHFGEFVENFVTMDRLYDRKRLAMFQTGVLRIDGKELHLCFHVESEGAHAALAERSKCCVVYAKLKRPAEGSERLVCAVVTAGRVAGLYVGRNGVFYDRDGKDWEAVVTRIVEAEVSLVEAFWAPWRKLGESVSGMVKKYFGDKNAAVETKMASLHSNTAGKDGGAAMASSVAAIGIGIGMVGAAAASILAAVRGMQPWHWAVSVAALILVVSLPSVVLTWFKLRKRDLSAILNACGWAMNRPMRFSMSLARTFTKC